MNRRSIVAGLVTLLVIAGAVALAPEVVARSTVGAVAKAGATNHTISVVGHGTVQVAPDMATVTLGVETKGDDAATALSNNATRMNAVIAAAEAQGVTADHIQTSDLSLYYDDQHETYVASHQITVTIDAIGNVGQVIDAAVGAGANNSWGVSFGLKDESAARVQALQAAVGNAQKRAQAIATALGVSISGVGSAAEASYTVTPPVEAPAAGVASSTPVEPGQLTVTADVNVVYTFG